jgi:hypothetical protein
MQLQHVEVQEITDEDDRVELRGQSKAVAEVVITRSTVLGPFAGELMTETEFDKKYGASIVAQYQHDRYTYQFTHQAKEDGGDEEDTEGEHEEESEESEDEEEDGMLLDPFLHFGNEAMAINDPKKMATETSTNNNGGNARKRKRVGTKKGNRPRANCAWVEVSHKGFPYVFM